MRHEESRAGPDNHSLAWIVLHARLPSSSSILIDALEGRLPACMNQICFTVKERDSTSVPRLSPIYIHGSQSSVVLKVLHRSSLLCRGWSGLIWCPGKFFPRASTFQFFKMACHHFLLLILQFGLSCAFHGPRPIQGYDILYLLADNTGFSDRFIRLGNPLNGTYPTTFPLVGSETPVIILAWTHLPVAERGSSDYVYNGTFDTDDDASDVLRQSLVQFRRYFSLKNAVVSLVLLDEVTYLSQFDDDPFSNWTIVNNSKIEGTHEDICILMYYCLFDIVLFSDDFPPDQLGFEACLRGKYDIIEEQFARATWRCYVQISSDDYAFSPDLTRLIIPPEYELTRFLNITRLFYNPNKLPCSSDDYNLVQENWMVKSVDYNLQVSLIGGVDRLGVYWQGGQVNEFFAETIGRQFWNLRGVKCTRATPCQPDLDCSRIGPYTALALGTTKKPVSIPWVLLASSAIKNINQQLVNQYDQLENAIESLALNAFTIDDFFPKKSQNPSLQNNLTGLSGIFTLGGFIPVGGPAIEAAGTIASSIGNFLSNSVSPASPTEAQDIFSQQVLVLYKALLSAMENVIAKLFEGVQLPTTPSLGLSSFNITDMMKGGAWVDPNAITNVSQLNLKVKTELLSRSIDSLWKTPPSNKMWVLFTDLKDDAKATSCNEGTCNFSSKDFIQSAHLSASKLGVEAKIFSPLFGMAGDLSMGVH